MRRLRRLATLGHLDSRPFFLCFSVTRETAQLRRTNEEQEMWAFAGAMARDLAHEALNGLKAIQSWISNSRATASPNYSQLEERAQQILRNVNDLLDSTGFEQSHKRRCIFNRELEKYLKQLGFRNNKYIGKCVIKLDVADFKQRWVNFDPATLIFVLHNLVLNAKEQYEQVNRAGPIEIRIVEKEFGGIPYIGFSVLDYAVGIAAENIFNVFDRGFTTKPNGRGIGLSTVKRLVDEAEGRIEVDSEPGRYAKFYVFYPVIQSDDDVS